ncbi:PfkB family carbohydrate kinase [Carnobacterium sp.]|uniref:carbohydrate kinase family protein n=1 Tax=Carnobacterium sp. TaxID=48221 RepID=UPI003FA57060
MKGLKKMNLNEKESLILKRILKNPFVTQQELADEIKLSRSATANLISGLVRKEYLLGKAYVLNESKPVICIGAANIDRRYLMEAPLIEGTTNDVKTQSTTGGVARSIAENLGRLEVEAALLSVVGNDPEWRKIKAASEHFMDVSAVDTLEGEATGTFMEVVNPNGDILFGLSDMEIYHCMTPEWLTKHLTLLKRAKYLVADLNLPKETLELLIALKMKHQIPLVLITVSVPKMVNMPASLDGVDLLIVKHDETEAFLNLAVKSEEDAEQAAIKWLSYGAHSVIVTKNDDTLVYVADNGETIRYKNPHDITNRYKWGANEAICAGLIYARQQGKSISQSLMAGFANGYHTTQSLSLVRSNLSTLQLEKDIEELAKVEKEYRV